MSKRQGKSNRELQQSQEVLRYWVEIRDQASGSVRTLPLNAVTKIHLPKGKKDAQKPREEILRLSDGATTLEAKNLGDLRAQLRGIYPDETYQRTLHWERDREAELRRDEAISRLSELLVPHAFLEALYVIQAELEREEPDSEHPDAEQERRAARRGIALIDAGKWKQRDTWIHLPPSWIRQILERFASGETSLLGRIPHCIEATRRR